MSSAVFNLVHEGGCCFYTCDQKLHVHVVHVCDHQEPIKQKGKESSPPVVKWHLQENSMYRMPSSYAWLVYYVVLSAYIALTI